MKRRSCTDTWLLSCFVSAIIFMLPLSWLLHKHSDLLILALFKRRHCPLYIINSNSMWLSTDTYATIEAEPHSVVSSKSWITRSGQQWIMTRKCRSQRLRTSWNQRKNIRKSICKPQVLYDWITSTGISNNNMETPLNSPQCPEDTRDFPPPPFFSRL